MKYHNHIYEISCEFGLPAWWVENIAIEYGNCREVGLGPDGAFWKFNFGKIALNELRNLVESNDIIIAHGFICHNVLPDDLSRWILDSMAGIPQNKTPHENNESVIPHGLIGEQSFFFQQNSLELVDPKLELSNCFQVRDNVYSKEIWQWHFASFQIVEGRSYGKYYSEVVDLEKWDVLHNKIRDAQSYFGSEYKNRNGDLESVLKLNAELEDFYAEVDLIRKPILKELRKLHVALKKNLGEKTRSSCYFEIPPPPTLSKYESLVRIDDGYFTRFYAEAAFFQSCLENVERAKNLLLEASSKVDYIYRKNEIIISQINSVIMAACCLEAYINGCWFDFESINKAGIFSNQSAIERGRVSEKFKILLYINGVKKDTHAQSSPYSKIKTIFDLRNTFVHSKHDLKGYPQSLPQKRKGTYLEKQLEQKFIEELPDAITEIIETFSVDIGIPIPQWLDAYVNRGKGKK